MFEILSVAENGGQSDSLAAKTSYFSWASKADLCSTISMVIRVDTKKNLTIEEFVDSTLKTTIKMKAVNLDSLIEFLEDARTFVREEEMIEALKGQK